jgi:hypothetical protein
MHGAFWNYTYINGIGTYKKPNLWRLFRYVVWLGFFLSVVFNLKLYNLIFIIFFLYK